MHSLQEPDEQHSPEISRLIDNTLKKHHKVYLATDWHLYIREKKNKPECHRCKNFDEIIRNVNAVMNEDDLLIYLGDLCDGEMVNESDEMKAILKTIPGKKILVRGNNDLFTAQYYKSCGFEYVVQSFEWKNILFTHVPCKNTNDMNIHGHIHGYRTYWVPYTNQIDVAACDGREKPVELSTVIATQPRYSKTIKVCPEKFATEYMVTVIEFVPVNIFEASMLTQGSTAYNRYDDDPYPYTE